MKADWVRGVMERYGQTLQIETAETTGQVRAFLQPLTDNSERSPSAVTGLGWLDTRLWLYLGRQKLADGDGVVWGETRLRVRSARPYAIGDEVLYWWALLETEKEAAE